MKPTYVLTRKEKNHFHIFTICFYLPQFSLIYFLTRPRNNKDKPVLTLKRGLEDVVIIVVLPLVLYNILYHKKFYADIFG